LQNLGSTPDAVARRVSLRKTPNAIRASSLPIVVAQPDKSLQTEPFYVGMVRQIQNIMVHTKEEL